MSVAYHTAADFFENDRDTAMVREAAPVNGLSEAARQFATFLP